jgi:methylamine---corrinoid protein Co-methyltransferase
MQNRPDMLEILSRTQSGEFCPQKEWDTKRIPLTIRKNLKVNDLAKTCDQENPVNTDMALADAFFEAAFELALELGYHCTDTERIIQVTREELLNAIKFAPSELFVGEGVDGTWLRARTPGDPYPTQVCASLAIGMSEAMYPIISELIAREREVDILGSGSMVTLRGADIFSGTPGETILGYEQAHLHREARRRAGRPGMAGNGVYSAVTEYGQFGGYGVPGGFRTSDLGLMLFPSEMKIDYRSLHKVIHTRQMGGLLRCDSPAMIGGMPGPAEGAVLSSIACALLSYAILGNDAGGSQIYDVRYLANVNREGLWAMSITQQALSRNTHLLTHQIANEVSGPGTKKLLYEIAAGVATIASSGASLTTGPRSAGGKLTDYITPLECRFTAEIAHASSGMQPAEINTIVKQLLPLYEDTLKQPDLGGSFQELYDLETLRPIDSWEQMYRKVKLEMVELGLPLDPS